ncbi:uncharacterized protein LOC142985258 isoform X2 [Anticarsia gemmatalis]
MENYVKYKLVGGMLKLKKNVVPHKFLCQKQGSEPKERGAVQKRRKNEIVYKILHDDLPTTSNNAFEEIYVVQSAPHETVNEDPLESLNTNYEVYPEQDLVKKCCKKIQVCIKNKTQDKSTMTTEKCLKKKSGSNKSRKPEVNNGFEISSKEISLKSASTTSHDFISASNATVSSEDTESEDIAFKNHMQKTAVLCISREPQLLLGIPKQCYFIIDILSEHCKSSHRNIMITLKKIRLYQSNALLALDFGLTQNAIGMIFRKTLPAMAACMKKLVFFPDSQEVIFNLPMAFRKRYSNVQSIIDCLEIQIEKPANAVQQALTWSEYKSCNTIKYLISITPDGLINFISEGYGGRTSDSLIFEDCGILEKIPRNAAILADRGFKNIAHLLSKKECTLLRPPSVFSNVTPTKDEVVKTKKIAALRIHVERSIGRMRHFGFLMPHACVDYKQIDLLDSIIVTACGIINLQSPLFDQSYDTGS